MAVKKDTISQEPDVTRISPQVLQKRTQPALFISVEKKEIEALHFILLIVTQDRAWGQLTLTITDKVICYMDMCEILF